jgi:hypothetical protein
VADVVGLRRELEDLIASYEQREGPAGLEHDGLAWDEATRARFFQERCDTFPALADAMEASRGAE